MSKKEDVCNLKTLHDWLTYYGNEHVSAVSYGLDRIEQIWQKIGKPKIAKKVITVAGTNGKGSTCQMLNLILRAQGYSVGVYTSPHLIVYNERICVNDVYVADIDIIETFKQIESIREEIKLSFFEVTTLAAFIFFAKSNLDFVILEVGLGGRLDATNIIDADAGIITSIGLDHTLILGDNLARISLEKAGIYRQDKVAVYSSPKIDIALLDYCRENKIKLIRIGKHYQVIDKYLYLTDKRIEIPDNILILGEHQINNATGAIVLLHQLDVLRKCPAIHTKNLSESPIIEDTSYITKALESFKLIGRMQKIHDSPCVIVDVAHNEPSAKALAKYLKNIIPNYNNIYAVIGILRDKDHYSIFLPFLGMVSGYYLGTLAGERGYTAIDLKTKLLQLKNDSSIKIYDDVKIAYKSALQDSSNRDLIVVFGSFHTVCEVLQVH